MTALRVLLIVSIGASAGHELLQLDVPVYADPRRPAELGCFYTRTPQDPPLHSVKWYRDAHEIFRYMPGQKPRTLEFDVAGVSVASSNCDESRCIISLQPLRHATTSTYTCEVSTEGPRFEVAKQTKQMTVAALPVSDPVITGLPPSVAPGEELLLNCTSDYSLPPADITWYIDDEPVKEESWQLTGGAVSSPDSDGLRASWRGLRLRAGPGVAAPEPALRCDATLPLQPPLARTSRAAIHLATSPHISKFTANGGARSKYKIGTVIFLSFFASKICESVRFL